MVDPAPSDSRFFLSLGLIAVSTFCFSFFVIVGLSHLPQTSHPKLSPSPGRLLGATTDIILSPTPSILPTPNLTPQPPTINHPFTGTLAYLKDNQIHTLKADRTSPDQITNDVTAKHHLTVSPQGVNLAYTYTPATSSLPDSGIAMINRQTKQITPLIESPDHSYSQLHFSPSGRYLSTWVDTGNEIMAIDTTTKTVSLDFRSNDDHQGVSPISWLPGVDQSSFILDSELFTCNALGHDLKSLALNVVALKLGTENSDSPLPPVWSPLGNNIAFVRRQGLFILNTDSKEETPVAIHPEEYAMDAIPYRPVTFTGSGSHLIYEAEANESGQTTYAYSLNEKKVVGLATYGSTGLLSPGINTLLGLLFAGSNQSQLSRYSLSDWSETKCSQTPIDYPQPPTDNLVNPAGNALISLTHDQGVTILSLVNLNTCDSYDLLRAPEISNPLWLPN